MATVIRDGLRVTLFGCDSLRRERRGQQVLGVGGFVGQDEFREWRGEETQSGAGLAGRTSFVLRAGDQF